MELHCIMLPIKKEATTVQNANVSPNHLLPNPRSSAYIGPPNILPSDVCTRYFMAKSPSAYFVEMPNTPVIQHQNTAPGPPIVTAVATPIMFPVPIVPAKLVASAENWLTSPVEPLSRCRLRRMALNIYRCGNRSRIVK